MKIFQKILFTVLRIGISIALLLFLFLFKQVDLANIFDAVKRADKQLLLLAFCVYFATYVLCLYRWQMLLKALNIRLPLKRVIISFAGGTFFSLLLPSTIGGDFMRSIDLALHTNKPRQVAATVLLDRLSGYVGLVILTLAALFWGRDFVTKRSILISVALLTSILIVVLLVLFNKFVYSRVNMLLHSPRAGKIRDSIKNLHQELHQFVGHRKVIVRNILLSVVVQMVAPITFYIIALALGIHLKPIYFFILLPIIGAITLLPISIGGLGLRENLTVIFFGLVGVAKDIATAMSLLSFAFLFIYGILGGLIYVLTVHHRRIQPHQPSPVYSIQ
jgi:uncharacterized protein (TIRG00374 family)